MACEIGAVLVCDDVRKEVTNKDILIGVYAADILVPVFPSWVNITVWIELLPKEVGDQDLIFRLSIGDQKAEIKIRAHAINLNPIGVALPGLQILAEKETEIVVEVKEGPDWRLLKRKKVLQGTLKLPLSVPPPVAATG